MYTYQYGGKEGAEFRLDIADDLVVVRTKANRALSEAIESKTAKNVLAQMSPVVQFPEAGVSVLQCRQTKDRMVQLRDRAREVFKQEKNVHFAGRVLRDLATGAPVVYTENFFVKFKDHLSSNKCRSILKKHQLTVKRKLNYARNAYFVAAPEGTGLEIFRIARNLLDETDVELCHPELIRETKRRAVASRQWHLQKTRIDNRTIDAHVNVRMPGTSAPVRMSSSPSSMTGSTSTTRSLTSRVKLCTQGMRPSKPMIPVPKICTILKTMAPPVPVSPVPPDSTMLPEWLQKPN